MATSPAPSRRRSSTPAGRPGRDTRDLTAPPPLPPPPPEPSSDAGAEAVRQAGREGLSLVTSGNSNSGYKGVGYRPKERGSKKYKLELFNVKS